jgi:hypothetical protein
MRISRLNQAEKTRDFSVYGEVWRDQANLSAFNKKRNGLLC